MNYNEKSEREGRPVDLTTLPVGTTFLALPAGWRGKIVEMGGEKHVKILTTREFNPGRASEPIKLHPAGDEKNVLLVRDVRRPERPLDVKTSDVNKTVWIINPDTEEIQPGRIVDVWTKTENERPDVLVFVGPLRASILVPGSDVFASKRDANDATERRAENRYRDWSAEMITVKDLTDFALNHDLSPVPPDRTGENDERRDMRRCFAEAANRILGLNYNVDDIN